LGNELPEGVKPWGVLNDFTWELIKAVQEQQILIQEKEDRITQLESQLASVLVRLDNGGL